MWPLAFMLIPVVTTIGGVKTEHELEAGPRNFTCIVHQQGIKVDVPTFVEVNPKNTIACMEAMDQKAWEWISTGPLFKTLYALAFEGPETNFKLCEEIPKTIEELNQGDMGIIHVCGMIVLSCEAFMAGKSIFVRNPETYLHPATERNIVSMFYKMMDIFGVSGKVETAVAEEPSSLELPEIKKKDEVKVNQPAVEAETPVQRTVRWLKCMDPAKKFAQCGEQIYTVADMILEVTVESEVGKQLVEQFVKNDFKIKGKDGN